MAAIAGGPVGRPWGRTGRVDGRMGWCPHAGPWLDPEIGLLHVSKEYRSSLAHDLTEPRSRRDRGLRDGRPVSEDERGDGVAREGCAFTPQAGGPLGPEAVA